MDQTVSHHTGGITARGPITGTDGSFDVGQRTLQSVPASVDITSVLGAVIHAKDAYTHEHSKRVGDLALRMGLALGFTEEAAWNLRMAGFLHDIGKIGMPDCILHKTGPLTHQEYEIVKEHPVCGARILANIPGLETATQVALHHHEHFDGSGYPNGLRGDEISCEARIVSVVDALDAMTSNRPYRAAMCRQAAAEIIREHSGTQFDPDVVAAFLPLADNGFFDDILERVEPVSAEEMTAI